MTTTEPAPTSATEGPAPEPPAVRIEVDGAVAVVTLDRPATRNVVSDQPLLAELIAACARLDADPSVRVVVLTGAGPAFSAGGNVRAMHEREGAFGGPPHELEAWYRDGIQRLVRAVHGLRAVTVAAVNGPAIGAGFDLALACDLRLASTTARFGETFVDLGIIPGDGGAWFLPRAVGPQRAAELTYTARIVDAAEAVDLGIVLAVHPPSDLLPAARSLAATVAAKSAPALRAAKDLLRGSEAPLGDVLDRSAALQALLHQTDEHRDAAAVFVAAAEARRATRASAASASGSAPLAPSTRDERLAAALGGAIPPPAPPKGRYVRFARDGDRAWLGGVVGVRDGLVVNPGKLGAAVDVPAGQASARQCALNHLVVLHHELGTLDRVERVLRMIGYIACVDGFTDQTPVLDGASEVLLEVLGDDAGTHARAALGVNQLGLDAPVEIEMVVRLAP
ncbi:MAG TPA: Atu1372/SO_1960 family protein [Iamia sp.]|nr:Atu1372/SO_1960 family protein [Iamia sp.]